MIISTEMFQRVLVHTTKTIVMWKLIDNAKKTKKTPQRCHQWSRICLPFRSSPPVFSGVCVTQSLVLCVCFVDRCLSICAFFFGHCTCVVCSSSIYWFWLPLWYLQSLLTLYFVTFRENKNLNLRALDPLKGWQVPENALFLLPLRFSLLRQHSDGAQSPETLHWKHNETFSWLEKSFPAKL